MTLALRLTGLAVAVLLSGCATFQSARTGTPENIITASKADSLPPIPDQWSAAEARVGEVQIGWIDALGDPVLSALVAEAQTNNRDLRVAALNVQRSWSLAQQARVGLMPFAGYSSGASRQGFLGGPAPDTASLNWGIQASWEPDIWGRVRAGEKAAIASAQSADADYRFAQYSIAAAVADAYLSALEASLQADVALQTLDTLSETNRVVQVQYDEGVAMAQDIALSAADLASTKASLIAAQGSYRNAIRAVEVLVGRYPAGDLQAQTSLPLVPDMPPAGLPLSLLERRPDIIASERTVAAAFYALDQVKTANLPSFSLTGDLGGNSSQILDILDPKSILVSIAANVTGPIFDAGLNKLQIEQARIEQEQAVQSYAQTVLTAYQDVETSLDQMVIAAGRERALRESAAQSDRAFDIATVRYQEGETDLLDTLTIQQRVFNARSALVSAQRARLDEWIDLNLALGGHW